MKLPNKIEWEDVKSVDPCCYMEVLVVRHKHTKQDWEILFGTIEPYDNYKKFRVFVRPIMSGLLSDLKEIAKKDVLAIGLIRPSYGMEWKEVKFNGKS